MRRHGLLRASDADRDAVVDRLRVAAGEGRLEPDELGQRVDRALRARTYGDLAELVADLPDDGRVLLGRAGWRTNPVSRSAVVGAGLLLAVTLVVALVAMVAVVLFAAAWWIALVLFWLVCCGSRRRLVFGSAGRHSLRARHAHRTRPTGFL